MRRCNIIFSSKPVGVLNTKNPHPAISACDGREAATRNVVALHTQRRRRYTGGRDCRV